jgi:hypothetical protein
MHTPTIAEGLRQLRRRKRDDVALIDKMREIGMKLFHRADQIDEEQLMKAQALLL